MIDFRMVEETVIPQFRGGEGDTVARMVTDDLNRIMRGILAPGCSIGMHCHDTSSEVVFILSGTGTVIHEGTKEMLPAGTCHYCKKGQSHTLINETEEDLVFFAVIAQQ